MLPIKRFLIGIVLYILFIGHGLTQETIDLAHDQLTEKTYNSAAILKTANQLIALGNERSYEKLLAYAPDNQFAPNSCVRYFYVGWLCLLLYDPKPQSTLEAPLFGTPSFPLTRNGLSYSEVWPKFPIAFSKNVPFQMGTRYLLGGFAYPSSYYLNLYHKNGIFRTKPYAIPTRIEAEAAFKELLTSPQWQALDWSTAPYPGKEEEIKYLHQQVERISP